MPTDKPRFSITLEEELVERINNYKFSHRMKNQTQAVVSLIEKGFESLHADHHKIEKSPAPEGAEDSEISLDEMRVLLRRLGLIGEGDDITEKDAAFVSGVFDLLEAWFSR